MKRADYERCKARALEFYAKAGIALTDAEKESVEVAEFDLGVVDNGVAAQFNALPCCVNGLAVGGDI